MYTVTRCLCCPDGALLHEFLSVDSKDRVFWTGWESEITVFNDYDVAFKYASALNSLYGYDICSVTTGPDWPDATEEADVDG